MSVWRIGTLVLAGAIGAASAGPSETTPCDNFGRVSPGLYRGAEPDDRCLEQLAGLGIRTVVSLRDEKDASDRERRRTVALGMRYVNVPMSGFECPALPEVRKALAAILEPGVQPVFVHCKRGRDRTGVIVATYRMAQEGWAADRAIEEAQRFGMAWWQVRMRKFIRDFDPAADQ